MEQRSCEMCEAQDNVQIGNIKNQLFVLFD